MIFQSQSYLAILLLAACHPRAEPASDPGNPAPVAGPAAGPPATTPVGRAGRAAGGLPQPDRPVPVRAADAPLVGVKDALEVDSLLGRRVRVRGRCTAAGAGRRAGSWTLEDAAESIEVRGLVPSSCAAQSTQELTIFAQIEPTRSDGRKRLLLRLPD
jgi:hypothetical protein